MGLLKSNLITLAGGVSTPTVDPTLALDLEFSSMTALPASITFARASIGTYFDKDGVLQTALSGEARFDHDPSTLEPLGLLIEGLRTNSLLNSAALGTQNVTVTAASWTLSFYGTGSVALSGVYTGTLVSAGAYPARAALTFTPTAGTLTLTPTGSVTNVQLERGSFPTSYIPTTTVAVPRQGDDARMTGVNFSSWYSAAAGTFVLDFTPSQVGATAPLYIVDDATNYIRAYQSGVNVATQALQSSVLVAVMVTTSPALVAQNHYKHACTHETNRFQVALNGVLPAVVTAGSAQSANGMRLGFAGGVGGDAGYGCSTIASLKFYNVAKSDAELIELTTP